MSAALTFLFAALLALCVAVCIGVVWHLSDLPGDCAHCGAAVPPGDEYCPRCGELA